MATDGSSKVIMHCLGFAFGFLAQMTKGKAMLTGKGQFDRILF